MLIRRENGFTLLEILIALFVFVIVSTIATTALHFILKTEQATAKRANELATVQIALLLLSRDIEQAIDRPVKTVTNEQQGFIGNADSVTLTRSGWANPEGELQRSTLQRVRYRLQDQHLLRETWATLDPINNKSRTQRSLLFPVTNLQFEYLDQKGRFQKTWPPVNDDNAPALPRAVRVIIVLEKWGTLHQLYLISGQSLDETKDDAKTKAS